MKMCGYQFVPLLMMLLLQPLPTQSADLSFLVIGDWGGQPKSPYTTPAEVSCAYQMGKYANMSSANFTIALGDNFYTWGVKDEFDPRFNSTFENVFTSPSLQHRWYVLPGNHDYYGNVTGEVAYTAHSSRWYFPSLYYSQTYAIPGSQATIQVIYIDTVMIGGLSHPYDPVKPYVSISGEVEKKSQWDWIESSLSSSKADWLLVAGHYPVWSIAEHGPTSNLVDNLRPMLEKYKVTAFLCGHDHNMQHLRENGSSVDYFVIGAGHLIDNSRSHEDEVPKGSLKFHYGDKDSKSDGAFASITVSSDKFTITYVNVKGQSVYQYSRSDPRKYSGYVHL